ncbi:unnamed protein product [Sphacelaria rigidula]
MEELFKTLQEDTQSLWQNPHGSVRRLRRMPSAATFFRDYVATSTPVIIEGGVSSWDAVRSWDLESLGRTNPELEVTVDCTPDGKGDCVVCLGSDGRADSGSCGDSGAVFVKPEERRMKFQEFADDLLAAKECCEGIRPEPQDMGMGVPYLSHQNDSLRCEFPGLMSDVEPFLELAREAFGNEPDAVNLWIGDDRSMSSVHKDHYENMYCVLRGEKQFTLLPPSDVLFLYEQEYPQGRYRRKDDGSGFEVHMEEGIVPWIPVDPACPDLSRYPNFQYASPVQCNVGPGDILYLPALWYHRVSQKGITIAVNYWHDMSFDFKYVYYRFLQELSRKRIQSSSPETTDDPLFSSVGSVESR